MCVAAQEPESWDQMFPIASQLNVQVPDSRQMGGIGLGVVVEESGLGTHAVVKSVGSLLA